MNHRKTLLTVLAAVAVVGAALPAAAGWPWSHGIDGSGDAETRSYDFSGFDRVRLDAGMDLKIRVGRDHRLEVTLDDNLFDNLVLEVEDGELLIAWEEDCDPDVDPVMELELPRLEGLTINGAGDVDIAGFDGGRFVFDLRGACDLEAEGSLDELEIDLHGAGNVDADRLKARSVDVRLAGAGDVDCWAEDSIRASIHGVGNITYKGDPAEHKTSVHGIGSIDAR